MNKKLLLVTLPVLLAMTGCQSARSINNQPENKALASAMAEDTLAHEDIFGGNQEAHIFTGKKTTPLKAALSADSVKIGYQIQFDDKKTAQNSADDTISIRFVAALANANDTAVWHRGLARPNGWEGAETSTNVWKYKFSGETNPADLTSEVKYDAVNNGGVRIAAGEEGEYEDYECFVIYTLMNIPYEEFKDSYLAAYVSLPGGNSQALAVKIEKDGDYSKNSFAFDPTVTGHFLQGKINGTVDSLVRATEQNTNLLYASYDDISLQASDSFGSFYFSPSHFQFFGHSSFFDGASDYFNASSLGEYNTPKAAGIYTLYVYNNTTGAENHVHVKNEVTLYLAALWDGWEDTHAFAFLSSGNTEATAKVSWPGDKMSYVGVDDSNNTIFSYTIDLGLYDSINFNNGGGFETGTIDVSNYQNNDFYRLSSQNGYHVEKIGSYSASELTSQRIIYFTNNYNWSNVNFYVFKKGGNARESWPGADAKWVFKNDQNQNVYRLVVDTALYDSFIFNNGGNGNQTVDILLSSYAQNGFYISGGSGENHTVGQWTYNPLA